MTNIFVFAAVFLMAVSAHAAQGTISANVYTTLRTNADGSIVVTDGVREITCRPRGAEYVCGGR